MIVTSLEHPPTDPAEPPRLEAAEHEERRRTGSHSRVILESVLIVLSVLLGFALNAWGERRAEHRLADAALANFRREIEANLGELERVQPKHAEFAAQLAAAAATSDPGEGRSAFEIFAGLLPEGGLDVPPLREAAWETAVSTGALRLLEYDLAARLSETYLIQRSTVMPTIQRLADRFSDTSNFDPAVRERVLRVHHRLITDLAGQEAYLIETYRGTLKLLPGGSD